MHLAAWVAVLALTLGMCSLFPEVSRFNRPRLGRHHAIPGSVGSGILRNFPRSSWRGFSLRELSRSEVHPAGALAATFLLRWRGWQGTRG